MSTYRKLSHALVAAATVLAVTLVGADAASARHQDHCVAPWGEDFNETFRTRARIVTSLFDCTTVLAGQRWTVPLPAWAVAKTFETTPPGYRPAGRTPIKDFLARFAGAKYVIDPGTARERTIFRPAGRSTWTDTANEEFDGVTAVDELPPLRPGRHVVDVYWLLRGTHCDGATDNIDDCLTGRTHRVTEEFVVLRRH